MRSKSSTPDEHTEKLPPARDGAAFPWPKTKNWRHEMDEFPKADTQCRCPVCQRTEQVPYAQCLQLHSWPFCHGQPMEPIRVDADINADVNNLMLSLIDVIAGGLRVQLRQQAQREGDDA